MDTVESRNKTEEPWWKCYAWIELFEKKENGTMCVS